MKKTLFSLKRAVLTLGLAAVFTGAVAQVKPCGTDQALQRIFDKYPEVKAQHEQIQFQTLQQVFHQNTPATVMPGPLTAAKTATARTTYTIPIVFHIVHEYGTEDITDAQVIDEVSILNKDYKRLNSDTAGVIPEYKFLAGNAEIQFKLATLDPQGNCTNGIEHIYSHLTNQSDDASKISDWPQNKYLNVWVMKTIGASGVAGYAFYPSAVNTNPYMLTVDGVIILNDYIGSIGTSAAFSSRALTHEIGHYLGLPHTWGNTNDPTIACGDDGVPDTPITKGHSTCPLYDAVCDTSNESRRYTFDNITTASGTTDPTPLVKDSVSNYSKFMAVGVSANTSQNGHFSFSNWDTGGANHDTTYANQTGTLNTSKYYEVTVAPKYPNIYLTYTGITFNFQRNGTGVRTFAVRSSRDGFTSNLPIVTSSGGIVTDPLIKVKAGNVFYSQSDTTKYLKNCHILLAAASNSAVATTFTNTTLLGTGPVTFRFYGWNAEDAAGTFGIDSLRIGAKAIKIENVQNYMEYSYCSKMFTLDQDSLMRFSLSNSVANRSNIVGAPNLAATGVSVIGASPCAPVSDFKANKRSICPGVSVGFTALPRNGTATSYNWTFTNGTPATSTTASPTVVFNTPGWQDVTLTVTNAQGSNTKTETHYIYVSWPGADYTGPFTEDLESNTSALNAWILDNPEGNESHWQVSTRAAYSGSHAFFLNNIKTSSTFDPNYDERLGLNHDALISPKYNLNYMTNVNFSFKYSCATRGGSASTITEVLGVYKSTDCGSTWTNIYAAGSPTVQSYASTIRGLTGGALANAGYSNGDFMPTSPTQWSTVSIPVTFISGTQGNVRFKIEYVSSDASNNIYIDDINVSGTVGIEESTINYYNLNVYPNPSENGSDLTVDYYSQGKKVTISMVDMLGRQIYSTIDDSQAGPSQKRISGSDLRLKAGMYFVNISDGKTIQTKKIIIN